MTHFVTEVEGIDEVFAELERAAEAVIRGISVLGWSRLLERTPQFYGRMAASWTYSLGAPVYVDRSKAVDTALENAAQANVGFFEDADGGVQEGFTGRHKGDPEAIAIANFASAGRDFGFKLGMDIWFANGVDHGEGPYSSDVEDGFVKLRPANRPGAPARRTLDWLASQFAQEVPPSKVEYLKGLRIG